MDAQAEEVPIRIGQVLRRSFFSPGTAYGLLFGLMFALVVWGYDGLVLRRSGGDLPWAKLTLGLPVSVLAGLLMGWLGELVDRAWFSGLLGGVVGCFLSVVAGHLPYEGAGWVTGRIDPRFAGLNIYPFGPSASARLVLTAIVGVVFGAMIGALQGWATDRARDHSTRDRRMTVVSWLVLLIAVPVFLPWAVFIDQYVDQPIRYPQTLVSTLVRLVATNDRQEMDRLGLNNRPVRPFVSTLSPNMTTYLIQYDLEALYDGYVDVAMDNGLILRCSVGGDVVYNCSDIGSQYGPWMDNLIHAGLTGEQRWLNAKPRAQAVRPEVVSWLQGHAAQMEGAYQVYQVAQHGSWLFLAARFENGFELVCRMSGVMPEVVDWCGEGEGMTR